MGCIRNRSRIWGSWLLLVSSFVCWLSADRAEARFAISFSPTLGELYTDNIFYTKNKEHDFVTTITPTLSILYAPEGQTAPILNLNISPSGVIFARHSELNNFGDNWGLNGGYTYQYSPDLSFYRIRRSWTPGQLPTWAVNSGCFSVAQRADFSATRWRDSPGTRQSKSFQFHFRGTLSFGIISCSGGHIFIDRASASRVVMRTISLITLTREGLIYGKPSAFEASITGGKSITSMREFDINIYNNRNNNNVNNSKSK